MKTVNIFLSILFLFAAVVQYNDQDFLPWMLIYGFSAAICGLYAWKPISFILPAIAGIGSFIWIIFLLVILQDASYPIDWSAVFGEAVMKTESVELTREILGLCIVFVWMGILVFYKRGKNHR